MPTTLVTGGAGFMGSHLADELVAMGHRVVVLDDLSGGSRANAPAAAELVQGSVTDHECVDRLFARHRFDHVFHFAAHAAEGLSHFRKRFNYTNNLLGSVNVINASVNAGTVRCFVFTSSIAVYGPAQVPTSESTIPRPIDPYGIAKYAVELDLEEARHTFGLDFVVFRPHNVYGERQNVWDRYRNVIGIFMRQILRGEPMTIFGDGEQTRAFTHIADVTPAMARSIERPATWNQAYNIGADEPCTVNRLATLVARAMGVEPRVVHLEPRHEVVHAVADHAKARAAFGDLKQGVTLEAGLARMAQWVRSVGARAPAAPPELEVRKNLPASWVGD